MEHLSRLSNYQTTSRVRGKISLYLRLWFKVTLLSYEICQNYFWNYKLRTTRNSTSITNLAVLPSIYDLHANFNEMKQLVYKLISNIVCPTKW